MKKLWCKKGVCEIDSINCNRCEVKDCTIYNAFESQPVELKTTSALLTEAKEELAKEKETNEIIMKILQDILEEIDWRDIMIMTKLPKSRCKEIVQLYAKYNMAGDETNESQN